MVYLWAVLAWAGGLYSGIEPGSGMAAASIVWTSPESGWMASTVSGEARVRVWVSRNESGALERFAERASGGDDAGLEGADESRCESLRCVARLGNLVLSVEGEQPREHVIQMLKQVAPFSPWPEIPGVRMQGQRVLLQPSCGFASFRARYRETDAEGWVESVNRREGRIHGPTPDAIDVSCWDRFGRLAAVSWLAPAAAEPDLAVPVP